MIFPMTTRGRGRIRGQAQRRISYDPSSGEKWRTGVVFPPDEAAKVIRAAERTGMSVAGVLAKLIQQMPVDAHGRPIWAHEQEELPNAG